ncbi:MAG TPA: contractile injection system protein, VgrG/Pvc8 family [Gemmatimonadaceae bacterium]|jgi:phage protein D
MTSVVPLGQESHATGSFYAPRFEVKIEGVGLPRDVLRDVVQLTYHDNVAELDGFEMVVNNWDAATRSFKYVGSETDDDLKRNDAKAQRYKLFEPCGKDVTVRMGYRDDLVTMLTGTVTTMEPSFPTSGGPTLTVRGLNSLHQLRRKPYTYAWENKKDSEIAVALASMTDDETHNKRFPMPVEIDTEAKGKETPIPYIAQQNQTDIDFLFSRARERGYVMFILEETKLKNGTTRPRRLYFGPSQGGKGVVLRNVIFELRWGGSLTEFKPTLTTANQVRSVTVRGWDRAAKKPIEEKIDLDDAELNRNQDLYRLLKRCDPREDVVTNLPVFNKEEAKARARALLQERTKIMVTANATTVGLPDLRAGQLVNIVGVGSRFSGTYFITDTTHTIGESGYTTQFNCRRETQAPASGS